MFCYPFEQIGKSKKEAKALGLRYYYTGKPCKRGHWSRRSKTSACMECERLRAVVYKAKNPDVVKRHNTEGWQRKKERFWSDEDYRKQTRYKEKMKTRGYRKDPEKSGRMRIANTEQKKAEYWRRIGTDEKFKCTIAYRNLIKRCVERGHKKCKATFEELGYSALEFYEHMEALFEPGMSWANHGDWHVDHIRPICTFPTGTNPREVNALSNLRPLWAIENIRRGRKWEE